MAKSPPPTALHIVVERAALLKALTATARAVEARNTIPILANVLLTATPEHLQVRGTDLDIEITTTCPATCTPGTITVPAKTLLEIVRKFPDGAEVTMSLEGETLIVKAGRSKFRLGTIDAASYPNISKTEFGQAVTLDLSALFKPVAFAASVDPNRYHLNGVFLHASSGKLVAVSTDGHRLAKTFIPYDGPDFAIIVPTKSVNLVPQGDVSVSVSTDNNKIRIEHGDAVMVSNLVQGTYPDYTRAIPAHNDRIVSADKSGLVSVLDRLSVVANERSGRGVKLTATDGNLALAVRHPDFGVSEEDMQVEWDGDSYEIGFNSGYLLDLLGPVVGVRVNLAFNEAQGPVLITGDNDNWLGVCMPMRV